MVRVREKGVVVPRFQVGRQRAVRGHLYVRDEYQADLRRHLRQASLAMLAREEPPEPLWDVQIIHASHDMLVLSGFERVDDGFRFTEYAQSWVLCTPRNGPPEGTFGPPYPR